MGEILISISVISSFLLIFFNTDAIPEWGRLLKLNKIFKWLYIDEYFKLLDSNILGITTYPEYLGTKYSGFLGKILFCQICSSFYYSLIAALFTCLWFWPIIFIGSILVYYLICCLMKNS